MTPRLCFLQLYRDLTMLLLIKFNVEFTEAVPTVASESELISNRYTVTTRMIPALKSAGQCPPITIFEDKSEPKRGVEPAPSA